MTPTTIKDSDVAIDHGYNPQPNADCPNCGTGDDIMRGTLVGISIKDKGRLCRDCIETICPGLAEVLDFVTDFEILLCESPDPERLRKVAVRLILAAVDLYLNAEVVEVAPE